MKTTSFRHNYALAAFAWCLLASMCCAQIIGSGVLGGGDIALKLDPAAAYDADNGTWADAAIQFNASDNSWLQMATNYDPGTNDFVLNAWVYLDSRTSYRTILCTGATSNGQDGIFWAVHSSGDVYFKLNDSTTGTAAYKLWSVALNTGTWYNLAVHVDRDGVASLYVDGVAEVDTLDVSDHQDSLGATGGVIGADLTGGNPYDGRIDSLFICQAADLSSVASDIVSWAYNAGEGRIYDDMTASQKTDWGLVSFCDFNGPVGGGWVDSHGTNHLTPQFADVIAPATFGSELLANGDLNDWTGGVCDGWAENSLGTGSVDEEPTIVHTSGGSSTKITTGDLSAINQRQVNIAVEASTSYRFAYWTRGDGTYDGSHRVYDETNAANIVDITSNGVTGTEWQLVTVDFTTPATCNTIFISLGGNGAVGAATYFDDVSLKQYTPGTLNGGLEEWTDVTRTQLVSNSGFDSAATDWTAENSASLASVAGGVEGNALEITNGGATAGRAYQSLTVTPGATYRLTLWHKNGTAQGGIWVGNGVANTAYFDITGLNDASWTQYEYHFVAVTTVLDIRARCYSTTAGHITLFDAIELIQIASNADDWTESTSGSSIIRRGDEPDHVDDGTHSLVMEVDIANSNASIRLEDVLTAAKRYSYTIRAKADSGTPSIYIGGLATGNRSVATLDTTWTEYTGTFATIDAKLYVGRNSAVAKTIYLDGFTLRAAEILPAGGIARGRAAAGEPVSYWEDQAGSLHAENNTYSQRPTLEPSVVGVNSHNVLTFDGVDDYLGTGLDGQTVGTLVVVVTTSGTDDGIVGVKDTGNRSYLLSTTGPVIAGGVATHDESTVVSGEDPSASYRIVVLTYGGDGEAEALYVDGTEEYSGTQSGAVSTAEEYLIGAINSAGTPGTFGAVSVAKVLIYGKVLSAGERAALTARLQQIYGLSP